MIRKIIRIDEEKCNGCGACASACHEGAIEMIDGKARLTRENYCDGLGDCLPACPTNAISFEEREAPAYDEAAVLASKAQKKDVSSCSCPGMQTKTFEHEQKTASYAPVRMPSRLRQFPVQIKLTPIQAPYFDGAHLLISADCSAYAYGNFHEEFMKNRVTLIGCPKLDAVDYSEKLTAIIAQNNIKSVTIARMSVPCCGGLEHAVKRAIQASGKFLPWQVVTITPDGQFLDR